MLNLQGGHDFAVVDLTDFGNRSTVSELGGKVDSGATFVNDHELSDAVAGVGLYRMALSGSPTRLVTPCGDKPFAWSPDGTAAVYLSGASTDGPKQVHLVSGGSDRIVFTYTAGPPWAGCGSQDCGDKSDTEVRLRFSPDGAYVALLFHLSAVADFRLWKIDGTSVQLNYADSTTAMGVWSGDTLYWEDSQGIERWRNGQLSFVMAGRWVRPHASPAGGQIVYARLDALAGPQVWLYDAATGTAREIAANRIEPAFLTSRYIWYRSGSGGFAYVYDLQTGVESGTDITAVWDVWPHGA